MHNGKTSGGSVVLTGINIAEWLGYPLAYSLREKSALLSYPLDGNSWYHLTSTAPWNDSVWPVMFFKCASIKTVLSAVEAETSDSGPTGNARIPFAVSFSRCP